MSNLSRRTLVTTVAALPALTVPALAAEPVSAATPASACTLPPDLVERFVRMREWYLDFDRREELWRDEIDRRFYAATGLHWRDLDRPFSEELKEAYLQASAATPDYEECDDECGQLRDERWAVVKAMMAHKPQTAVDLAWQAEAYLLADLEVLTGSSDWLIRTLFHHIRTLGALPQPDDPLGALHINIDRDDDAEG